MPYPQLNRQSLRFYPLAQRTNKVRVDQDLVGLDWTPRLSDQAAAVVKLAAARIRRAKANGRPVVMAFGAHTIKNGLAPVLIRLIQEGWVQHLATNGAGIIHDWEMAFLGQTSENVAENTGAGKFGMWQETGFNINLAIALGAYDGLGYGEAVGRLIASQQHVIPEHDELQAALHRAGKSQEDTDKAAAAADLLGLVNLLEIPSGIHHVKHAWAATSVQAAAFQAGTPFTGHPMFGHDIIYTHPANLGAAIGRTAQRDFLTFAQRITELTDGVYLSVGSAVMSPMIFEKSLSMAQNLAHQSGQTIRNHTIIVVDLADSQWDWRQGEPPQTRPEYYLRYCKTFNRMGGEMHYASADNRDFLSALYQELAT